MDLVLEVLDSNFLTPYVYPPNWKEDDIVRQTLTILAILNIGAAILYLVAASLNYYFIFDHRLMDHPLFLKVKVKHNFHGTLVLLSGRDRQHGNLEDRPYKITLQISSARESQSKGPPTCLMKNRWSVATLHVITYRFSSYLTL